ncbi:glycosyltransferase involved in cell wall biosynthesis [Parabacteroides sp. PFB2-10]|uniref:glycosyltransferase family 2 protein n=1 Tax=Parabacteroides sp. PFB2-10 TaxID=1742405 RepID=UPI0024771101|nr:glycosyltransferase family 2 protein [Parabacteroides sp. PFB2-10]MDH6312729.1 glycosyltransferase involved in cell wall biosynthesis [Parabacteroides sp. PFB2-10]
MKVSIITCTYNSQFTIVDTMLSVNRQTYPHIEHIIVDGLSADKTLDIIGQYASDRQTVVSEKDKGLYDALNKGIRLATGDIIGILNSDDFFTDERIVEHIVDAFAAHPVDAVYGDIHFVKPTDLSKSVRKYSSKIFKRPLMRLGFMPAHPSFYMKRGCYEQYGLYKTDYKICADFELLLRYLYIHQIKTAYLPMNFVTMRTGGLSTNGFSSHKQIMKEHLRAFRENGVSTNRFLLSLRYLYKITEYFRR